MGIYLSTEEEVKQDMNPLIEQLQQLQKERNEECDLLSQPVVIDEGGREKPSYLNMFKSTKKSTKKRTKEEYTQVSTTKI